MLGLYFAHAEGCITVVAHRRFLAQAGREAAMGILVTTVFVAIGIALSQALFPGSLVAAAAAVFVAVTCALDVFFGDE
jgi:hypothetical protein